MNDPLKFTGVAEPIAITQSSTFAGQQLPDKDFSEAKHKQISLEVVAAFMGGYDDIGALEEMEYDGQELPNDGRVLKMTDIERMPHGNYEQGQALLKMQAEQEFSLRREGHAGPDIDYVKGRDYGKPDPELTGSARDALIQKVIEHARKNGVELTKEEK